MHDSINVIAKEARKFGIGLWCSTQNPTAFPEDFLTNVGATVLLGIHPNYWRRGDARLRVPEETLKWIRSKETLAVKLQMEGISDPPFIGVLVPNPNSELGRRAAAFTG